MGEPGMTTTATRSVWGGAAGALLGVGMWVVMIVVTTGVCSVPVLSTLWCTVLPIFGPAVYSSISLWDMFLLVVFIVVGASTGSRSVRRTSR
jgi:hypothetical protein